MELISALMGLLTLMSTFGLLYMFLTFPSWLMGRMTRKPRELNSSVAAFIETRPRRWGLWALTSTIALMGLYQLVLPPFVNMTLGIPMLLVGTIGAQWSAYQIGRAKTEANQVASLGERPLEFMPPPEPMPTYAPPQPVGAAQTMPLPTVPVMEHQETQPLYGPEAATDEYPLANPVNNPYSNE